MKKNRINWISFFALLCGAMVFGIIGIGLPNTINLINHFKEGALYGYFASYVTISLLFWFCFRDLKLVIKRESYFISIDNFIKEQLLVKRKKRR